MENIATKLPPELIFMIISYLEPPDQMNLAMASSQLASFFVPVEKSRYWRVDCCTLAARTLELDETSVYPFKTDLNSFIEAYENDLAPVSAQRVIFDFCRHRDRRVSSRNNGAARFDSNCSTERVAELFRLLNARRITISVKLADPGLSRICNEPLVRDMLRYSIEILPNAVVNFQMKVENGNLDFCGSYFMTIRDPSMLPGAVETNLQLALFATTIPPFRRDDLWDSANIRFVSDVDVDNVNRGFFPKLRCLTCPVHFDCTNPDELLEEFPTCVWPTARYWNNPDMEPIVEYPGSTFYFEFVPEAAARHCTRISAHAEDYQWVLELLESEIRLEYVKELDFHLTGHNAGRLFNYAPLTPSALTPLLSCCLGSVPNVETINFMFDPEIWNDMARPELFTEGQSLRTDFCQHCQQDVYAIEIDIWAIRHTLEVPGSTNDGVNQFRHVVETLRALAD